MAFNHSKLIGRIIEMYGSRSALAKHIGWTDSKLASRLSNKVQFDAEDIYLLSSKDVLDIPDEEIATYFFTV